MSDAGEQVAEPAPTVEGALVQRGTGRRAVETAAEHRRLFIEHYLSNGHNGKEAAISAGYSPKCAKTYACALLKEPAVRAAIAARSEALAEGVELSTEKWARDLSACCFSSAGDLYDGEGKLKPLHLLPDAVKRAIASVSVQRRVIKGVGSETTTVVKFWSKTQALETLAKHLGLFELHNKQQPAAIRVQIELMG